MTYEGTVSVESISGLECPVNRFVPRSNARNRSTDTAPFSLRSSRNRRTSPPLETRLGPVDPQSLGCGSARLPKCGGRLRIISFIEDAAIIEKILRHLKLWDPPARPPPPRASTTLETDADFLAWQAAGGCLMALTEACATLRRASWRNRIRLS